MNETPAGGLLDLKQGQLIELHGAELLAGFGNA
jgi:hypothetical protein